MIVRNLIGVFTALAALGCDSDSGGGATTDASDTSTTTTTDTTVSPDGTKATTATDATATTPDSNDVVDTGTQQGSETAPVTLTVGTPYAGSVVASGKSYYEFTTLDIEATFYKVHLTNTHSDLRWEIYNAIDATAAGSFVMDCDHYPDAQDEVCGLNLAPRTTYYLRVLEVDGVGGSFTVLAEQASFVDGPVITPIVPGTRLTNQTVEPKANHFHSFTAASVDMRAVVSLFDGTTNLALDLYFVNDFGNEIAFFVCDEVAGPGDETCTSALQLYGGITFYVRVRNLADVAATYDILVEQGGGTAEGSQEAPVVIDAAAAVARPSTVDVEKRSWYRLDEVVAGQTYEVVVADASDVAEVEVFSDPDFSVLACDATYEPGAATCSATATTTSLWVRVSARKSVRGATFSLESTPSKFKAIELQRAYFDVPIAGNGSAYFSFFVDSLIGDHGSIDAWDESGALDLAVEVFTDSALQSLFVRCNAVSGGGAPESCRTPGFTPHTLYYLKIENLEAEAGTFFFQVYP